MTADEAVRTPRQALEEWRRLERRLGRLPAGHPARKRVASEINRVRDEYRAAVDAARERFQRA